MLRVWAAWGEDKTEVRLVVKRGQPPKEPAKEPAKETAKEAAKEARRQEAGAGQSSLGDTPSREVRRRRSRMVKKLDTVHPK